MKLSTRIVRVLILLLIATPILTVAIYSGIVLERWAEERKEPIIIEATLASFNEDSVRATGPILSTP
ncbi:unnamed protein product, partial [marine sediment metagenome]